MKRVHGMFVVVVAILVCIPMAQMFATLPGMGVSIQQVTPQEARPGDVVTATGYGLGATHVLELYLIDSQQVAYRVALLDQMDAGILFRVPAKVPAGPMRLAVKLAGRATLLEQPAFLTIL